MKLLELLATQYSLLGTRTPQPTLLHLVFCSGLSGQMHFDANPLRTFGYTSFELFLAPRTPQTTNLQPPLCDDDVFVSVIDSDFLTV